MEFKGTKEEKALKYAKEAWGVYFDDKHPDSAIEFTMGEITQNDFLTGYKQAIKDSKAPEMLEMLKYIHSILGTSFNREKEQIEQLIKEATEITNEQ